MSIVRLKLMDNDKAIAMIKSPIKKHPLRTQTLNNKKATINYTLPTIVFTH